MPRTPLPYALTVVSALFLLSWSTFLVKSEGIRHGSSEALTSVLSGFVYVGTADYDGAAMAVHETVPLPQPATFLPSKYYVFHRRLSDGPIAYEHLERNLKQAGFRILKGPRSATDLTYLVVGEPLFRITFQFGDQTGTLFNAVDSQIAAEPSLRHEWNIEDLILTINP